MNSLRQAHSFWSSLCSMLGLPPLRGNPGVARRQPEPSPTDKPFANRPRVMVVDDVEASRWNVEELLWPRGIRPVHAADGAEAVALACGQRFDLILMDIQMPVLDGLKAAAQIRHYESTHGRASAAIVAYTSGAIADDEEGLRACGIDGSLGKPCTAQSLEACLLRWCAPGQFDDLPPQR